MDRMKTTLVSLNEKLAVLTDIKTDADDFKGSFGMQISQVFQKLDF